MEFWNFCDEITEAYGFIQKGERLAISAMMRKEILNNIYESHLGIVKCKKRACFGLAWVKKLKK